MAFLEWPPMLSWGLAIFALPSGAIGRAGLLPLNLLLISGAESKPCWSLVEIELGVSQIDDA